MRRYGIACFLCFSVLCSVAGAEGYYVDEPAGTTGFWWYNDDKPQKQPDQPEPERPTLTFQQLWDMHPDDFQSLLTAVQKRAVQNPTTENVKEYLYVQSVARQKSSAFSRVAMYVARTNPELNAEASNPSSPAALDTYRVHDNAEVQLVVNQNKDRYMLVQINTPECVFCKEQTGTSIRFAEDTGYALDVLPADEFPVPPNHLPYAPLLYLVDTQTGNRELIAAGAVTYIEYPQRIYDAIMVMEKKRDPLEIGLKEREIKTRSPLLSTTRGAK